MNRASGPRLLSAAAGATAAAWLVVNSLDPRTYFRYAHRGTAQPWTHPSELVVLVVLSTLAEAWVLYAVVDERRRSPLWSRALLGLLVLVPWGMFTSMFVIHAPGFVILHAAWVWGLTLLLVVLLVVSAVHHLVARWRLRRVAE